MPRVKKEVPGTPCCECKEKNMDSETYLFDEEETEADSIGKSTSEFNVFLYNKIV